MASVVTTANDHRRIEFRLQPRSKRRVIRLGKVSARVAETWKNNIEMLISDRILHRPHSPELSRWISQLNQIMLDRLAGAGLVEGIGMTEVTLGELLERYMDAATIKDSTRLFYGHTCRNLRDFFGDSRLLQTIDEHDADSWRAWLAGQGKNAPTLAQATIGRRVIAARTIWNKAVRWRLAQSNPFVHVKAGHQMNSSRQRFISKEMIEQVLAATDDLEWRAIIVLSRFGGLRCPSEHLCLQWRDIDWEAGSMLVRCPKLAHIEHCATRKVPLFPEVYAQLLPLFEQSPSGTQYVINRYREPNTNLGTQFKRIIKRSKLEPWPRLFQNLRASRETELMRQYDLTTVCKWIGNSPAIAARHYAMSQDLDSDFLRAADRGQADKAQQKAQQPVQENDDQGLTAIPGENQKAVENAGKMHSRQEMSSSDKTVEWAIQDSNL